MNGTVIADPEWLAAATEAAATAIVRRWHDGHTVDEAAREYADLLRVRSEAAGNPEEVTRAMLRFVREIADLLQGVLR